MAATVDFLCAKLSPEGYPSKIEGFFWMQGEMTRNQMADISIHQNQWVGILKRWHFAGKRIIEVDVPNMGNEGPVFEETLKYVREADESVLGLFDIVAHAGEPVTRAEAMLALSTLKELISFLSKQGANTAKNIGRMASL